MDGLKVAHTSYRLHYLGWPRGLTTDNQQPTMKQNYRTKLGLGYEEAKRKQQQP